MTVLEAARDEMGIRIMEESRAESEAYLYLQEVLWRAIDLFEALLSRIWHCLHDCDWWRKASFSLERGLLTSSRYMKKISESWAYFCEAVRMIV